MSNITNAYVYVCHRKALWYTLEPSVPRACLAPSSFVAKERGDQRWDLLSTTSNDLTSYQRGKVFVSAHVFLGGYLCPLSPPMVTSNFDK